MRPTVEALTPTAAAIVRRLQWVALAGVSRVVLWMICCTVGEQMAGLRPGRGASFSMPATPDSRKRLRQRATN